MEDRKYLFYSMVCKKCRQYLPIDPFFSGNGITLLGQANCSYDVTLDSSLQAIGVQQPANTLYQGSGFPTDLHNITLSSHANGDNQTLTFYGAVIQAPV